MCVYAGNESDIKIQARPGRALQQPKLNTAHRSLVLLGHAERFAAKRRWVAGPRRRRRLARQEPSHKKKPRQHKKERCSNRGAEF